MAMRQLSCVFAGGGTGGHLFPGIAVVEELVARNAASRIVFAGSDRPLERQCLQHLGIEHRILPAEPLITARRNPVRFVWRNLKAIRGARSLLRKTDPDVVVGLGSFASAPVLVAARQFEIPTVLLEQNVTPGRATKWFARSAAAVCTSFQETTDELPSQTRIQCIGNPVRQSIAVLHQTNHQSRAASRPTLLVLGGSQGAMAVNAAMLQVAEMLKENLTGWRIVHQTGAEQIQQVRNRYTDLGIDFTVASFFEDLSSWYQQASIVVSRAGATTLAELACAGIPALFVPYPHAVGNHQLRNARVFERKGAAVIVEQQTRVEATARCIAEKMLPMLTDRIAFGRLQRNMAALACPDGAKSAVDVLLEVTGHARIDSKMCPTPRIA